MSSNPLIEATYTRRREPLLARANRGIEKLRFLFRLATDLEYLDPRRYQHAARTLALADRIVDGASPQEPLPLYYPGDDRSPRSSAGAACSSAT